LLAGLNKAYFVLVSLNLDPDCTRYQVMYLKKYRIYLDSHIVLRSIVRSGSASDICQQITTEGKRRGIRMCVTAPMLNEIRNSINSANTTYERGGGEIARILKIYEEMKFSSDVFDGYMSRRAHDKHLKWSTFLDEFWSLTEPEVLKNYIEKEMGISVVKLSPEMLKTASADVDSLTDTLLALRNQMARPDGELTEEGKREQDRNLRLRNDEALQMLSVYHDRSTLPDTEQVWFVTFDEFVYKANAVLSHENDAYAGPCYIPPARWLELMSAVAAVPIDTSAFRAVLMSKEMRDVADIFESKVIDDALEHRVDLRLHDATSLKHFFTNVINRPAMRSAFTKYIAHLGSGDEAAASKDLTEIMSDLGSELASAQQATAVEQKKKEHAQRTSRYYKSETGKLQSQVDKRRGRRKKGKRK
jgi:hypothetical protein